MIIGISGKIGSGKDTIGKIIQYLTCNIGERATFQEYIDGKYDLGNWEIKKMADKLKDMVCMLIGCTREELEDINFKNKPLGEEWIRYGYADGFIHKGKPGDVVMNYQACDKERYELELRTNWQTAYKSELTPRLLLQLLGTECLRNIIHPNVHINALFSDYKCTGNIHEPRWSNTGYPNWIITDVRFPNEARAIRSRNGLLIRVNRPKEYSNELYCQGGRMSPDWNGIEELPSKHPSEIGLDDYPDFDYIINNSGTIEELIDEVKFILKTENII